ncbi:hypothetical protein [Thermoflavimicrobium dichotomicum]|uniref:Uncharacterized protein n=1 Tax=Thermoflavimicrobium dichotomicum TaxID=46223 RepID=A0A1I3TRY3_9BACL|nr:hypothetical protein [Thermoflavimicrobium dichotomicum]SFJ74028.1 hypothetical protein SAMN05421852_11972 [Thermoflavimicrobium dichotomicum]
MDYFKVRKELLTQIHCDILDSLKHKNLLFDTNETQVYLVIPKTIYRLNSDRIKSIIKQMKKELTGAQPLSKQTFALYLLLQITEVIHFYFSKDKQHQINRTLKQYIIENQEIKEWIQQLLSTGTKISKRKSDDKDDEGILEFIGDILFIIFSD